MARARVIALLALVCAAALAGGAQASAAERAKTQALLLGAKVRERGGVFLRKGARVVL